jgi:hypothetical protein
VVSRDIQVIVGIVGGFIVVVPAITGMPYSAIQGAKSTNWPIDLLGPCDYNRPLRVITRLSCCID